MKRPKIRLKLTTIDIIMEISGWTTLIIFWILTIKWYFDLPDTIPMHYGITGKVDKYGYKGNIMILPMISTILFTGMTIINKFPHIFNYPVIITQENALKQYTFATRLIRYLKLIIVVFFGYIVFNSVRVVKGNTQGLGIWFIIVLLLLLFMPLICFIIISCKEK